MKHGKNVVQNVLMLKIPNIFKYFGFMQQKLI